MSNNVNKSLKLIEQLDKLVSQAGENFGPIILEELKLRIDKTINDFNDEVSDSLKISFKNYKNDFKKYKEFKSDRDNHNDIKNIDDIDKDVPSFIKEHKTITNKK